MFAGRFDFLHWVLRDDATIVFYFHVELIVREDSAAELEDLREAVRAEPVVDIAADVCLKNHRFVSPGEAAAVDEVFDDVTYLGDVGMRRNDISIWQDKARKRVGMLFEDFSKSGEFHERSIFLFENIVNSEERRGLTADYADDTDGENERSCGQSPLIRAIRVIRG